MVLRRRGDSTISCQVREKRFNLLLAHFIGMSPIVKQNEPLRPGDIGLLGPIRKAIEPTGIRHLIEELGSLGIYGRVTRFWRFRFSRVKLRHMMGSSAAYDGNSVADSA